jgi:hypothetical protein
MQLNRQHFAEFFRTDFYTVSVIFPTSSSDSDRIPTGTKKYLQDATSTRAWPAEFKRYTYKIPKTMSVALGDLMLVCTSNAPHDFFSFAGLKTVQVVEINKEPEIEGSACFDYKWIVGRLDEVMKPYLANIEGDLRLKRAVSKLEAALERVSLRKQIISALEELGPEEAAELQQLFGTDLLGERKELSKEQIHDVADKPTAG